MRSYPALILSSIGLLTLASCRKQEAAAPSATGTPELRFLTVEPITLPLKVEQPGRMEAFRQAEVRARVPGIVLKRPYEEGQNVKEGTPLFLIDPAPLKAKFEATEAALLEAEATLALSIDKRERFEGLIKTRAVSERDYSASVSEEKQSAAQLAVAKANREMARLELEYTTVTSPIDGRARRANVTEGALVGQDSPTLLTTVEQIDPIYANFSQPAAEVMALRDLLDKGATQGIEQQAIQVRLVLANGSVHPDAGRLLFSDLAVDPGTDSVAMRAVFPNPDRKLLPGMYVRVTMDRAEMKNAILVPRVALVRTPEGAQVMTLSPDDTVVPVNVKADTMHGDRWLVTEGLKQGDRVIVENAGMLAPGTQVKPVPVTES
jgi:multidrug efflux system membrane fusion protein